MYERQPANWAPPYPAWDADFGPATRQVVMAYYGTQGAGVDGGAFAEWFLGAAKQPGGPFAVERARIVDAAGATNDFFAAYWLDPATYAAWCESPAVARWWSDPARQSGERGYWREVMRVPRERFETLFSSENRAGVARGAQRFVGPIKEHAYWGGMRDRLAVSAGNPLASPLGDALKEATVPSRGRRLVVKAPENLALIRSAQDWAACGGEELDYYMTNVHPTLIEGMTFLRDHPLETGCATCRFADELTLDGKPLQQTFGMAYFLTLGHLERWAQDHPTHLKIFGNFFGMAKHFNLKLDLRLWHEVSVLPAEGSLFEYVNVHPKTGLLPYFSAA